MTSQPQTWREQVIQTAIEATRPMRWIDGSYPDFQASVARAAAENVLAQVAEDRRNQRQRIEALRSGEQHQTAYDGPRCDYCAALDDVLALIGEAAS